MQIEVYGTPAPQGSKRVVRGRLIDTNQQSLRDWRNLIQFSIQGQKDLRPIFGPVSVVLDFWLARPKHHFGAGRNAAKLKPSAPRYPTGKPDIDKLVRAVLDALTDVVFRDDSQVCALAVRKRYAHADRQPGVTIMAREVE